MIFQGLLSLSLHPSLDYNIINLKAIEENLTDQTQDFIDTSFEGLHSVTSNFKVIQNILFILNSFCVHQMTTLHVSSVGADRAFSIAMTQFRDGYDDNDSSPCGMEDGKHETGALDQGY